jgi:hypothetical protein
VVHEFFCIRNGGVNKPHVKHEEKTDEEYHLPAPFCPELIQGIMAVPEMVTKKCQKWQEGNLYRYMEKPAVPGKNGEYQE